MTNRPRGQRAGRLFAALGAALLVIAWGAPTLGGRVAGPEYAHEEAAAASETLTVNLTDAPAFSPGDLAAPAGSSVTFALHNVGGYAHSFALSGAANVTLNRSWTPAELDHWFTANGSSVNVSLAPGAWANATLALLPSWGGSSFEFASLVPYQFQAGMLGFLNVTGASAGPAFTFAVQAATSALAFAQSAIEVAATAFPVTIEAQVSNLGSNAHTWTLVPQAEVNLTPGNFTTYFQSHLPAANVNIPTSAGPVVTANFTLPRAGTYEYICEVPGHFANGMYGFLYVGVPLPSVSEAPSTAIVEEWVLAAAGGLLALGVLLAVISAFVGRFPPKPPNGPY